LKIKFQWKALMANLRGEAIKVFENEGFPTKKNEDWKYTSLTKVLKEDFSVFANTENTLNTKMYSPI